jgi:hypothetical protein
MVSRKGKKDRVRSSMEMKDRGWTGCQNLTCAMLKAAQDRVLGRSSQKPYMPLDMKGHEVRIDIRLNTHKQ